MSNYEHMNIPGELSDADMQHLANELSKITLPDGRKPFTVELEDRSMHVNHEILLKNQCCTAVLLFHKVPKWKEQ